MTASGASIVVSGWFGVIITMATDAAALAYTAEDTEQQ